MSNPFDSNPSSDLERRTKQLESLIKITDTQISLTLRLANLLMGSNAAGIILTTVLLKDLGKNFADKIAYLAALAFAVGLLASGSFYLIGYNAASKTQKSIIDLILNED